MTELVARRHDAHGKRVRVSIVDAVERQCERTFARGRMEEIAEETRNAARMLGHLIERLVDKDVLSAKDVTEHVLSNEYEVVTGEGGS